MKTRAEDVRFDERGLVPAIVQDARTREVLTLAYMNAESLRRTLESGETWFWSRSRGELWHKGATSGHTQRVVGLSVDCDEDALVVLVEPAGPACHTGARTCFHHEMDGAAAASLRTKDEAVEGSETTGAAAGANLGETLEGLYAVVEARRRERPEGSYTSYLFEKGLDKILKKVGEETAETIIAAKNGDNVSLAAEVSDLLYHLVVLLVERGLSLEEVGRELERRSAPRSAG